MDLIDHHMKYYSCVEGNIQDPNGKNTVNIGSGHPITLSTGNFQAVNGAEIKNPTLRNAMPLSDRKEVNELKVVIMPLNSIMREWETDTLPTLVTNSKI